MHTVIVINTLHCANWDNNLKIHINKPTLLFYLMYVKIITQVYFCRQIIIIVNHLHKETRCNHEIHFMHIDIAKPHPIKWLYNKHQPPCFRAISKQLEILGFRLLSHKAICNSLLSCTHDLPFIIVVT